MDKKIRHRTKKRAGSGKESSEVNVDDEKVREKGIGAKKRGKFMA